MKLKSEFIRELENCNCEFVSYGDRDYVLKDDALMDIESMTVDQYSIVIGDGKLYKDQPYFFSDAENRAD